MIRRKLRVFAVAASFIILGVLAQMACAADVPRMSKEELKSMLGNPGVTILDVRASGDWDNGKTKIQGAIREDPNKSAKSWADKYSKDKTIVLY
jgi:hypothetical protein